MLKSFPLERMYRDARCGSLMFPWTAEAALIAWDVKHSMKKAKAI